MKVDVCIPVYRPGDKFRKLIKRLAVQSLRINALRIVNTCEEYWDDSFTEPVRMAGIAVFVSHVTPEEFDHGRVRDMMARESDADIIVFMTDDAVPAGSRLIERLVSAFDEDTGAVYARQLPDADCALLERMSRAFNYPKTSRKKTAADLDELGIKTYFCSNVCAAYDRKKYIEFGGFTRHTIFNEDMIFAREIIENGYAVCYCADARVIHSHNYTLKQYFKRSFDMAVSQADNPQVFAHVSSEKEGAKLVKAVGGRLIRRGDLFGLFGFFMQCFCKYAGYFLGKRYRKLPKKMIMLCTSNKFFWKNN